MWASIRCAPQKGNGQTAVTGEIQEVMLDDARVRDSGQPWGMMRSLCDTVSGI